MIDRCVRNDTLSCDPSRITWGRGWCGWGHNQRSLSSCTCQQYGFLLCHGFIKLMYINMILMKTRPYYFYITSYNVTLFFYMTCYNVNYFVSQPVGLDFTSGSGFGQWVYILPVGMDFASGSGYEDHMGYTPCCTMWSTHNYDIIHNTYEFI